MEIIDRKTARDLGLKHYFTGVPCKNGGVGERAVRNGGCVCDRCKALAADKQRARYASDPGKHKLSQQRYYAKNSDKLRQERVERYKVTRDDALEYSRRYRAENPEVVAMRNRRWAEVNREHNKERYFRYKAANADRINARRAVYREVNRERLAEQARNYAKLNPGKVKALTSKRRANLKASVPVWFGEWDELVLHQAFELASDRSSETGLVWHVDPMVPLQARRCSGLHCADNIQVIPGVMNLQKSNRLVLTERLEWLKN